MKKKFYFFVIYQLSGIQAGVQCIHSAVRYVLKNSLDLELIDFVHNHETVVVLNGGTTNSGRDEEGFSVGTINQIYDQLLENGITVESFHEPDLNNAMTSVCFLADERAFDRVKYPNFPNYVHDSLMGIDGETVSETKKIQALTAKFTTKDVLVNAYPDLYNQWLELIGGKKNEFLRDLIENKKLFS